jgi:hypothetical protein
LAIGFMFYTVKTGVVQGQDNSSPLSERVSALEVNVLALDARLKLLENVGGGASQHDINVKPDDMMPPPLKPEVDGGADVLVPGLSPQIPAPKVEDGTKPDDKNSNLLKPQSDNVGRSGSSVGSLSEKKSSI